MGITRKDGKFYGVPVPKDLVKVEDVVTVYGNEKAIKKLICEVGDCD